MTTSKCSVPTPVDSSCLETGNVYSQDGPSQPSVKDTVDVHLENAGDWFSCPHWHASESNTGCSTGRHSTSSCTVTQGQTGLFLEAEKQTTAQHLPSRETNRPRKKDHRFSDSSYESTSSSLRSSTGNFQKRHDEENGPQLASATAPSCSVSCVTVKANQSISQTEKFSMERHDAKASLLCGPLAVQKTLTERQRDIERRMIEVRQQNKRRLHRRQQEVKEQQLQRLREQRAALLARKERIRLASLWKERGMAAAARPPIIAKRGYAVDRLASQGSDSTGTDSRSANMLLAALVMSESISLQRETGASEAGNSAVLTFLESMFGVSSDVPSKMTTGTVASSHLRSCLPGDCAALTPVETPENRLKEKNSCKQFDLKHATCESLRCHSWDKRALLKELPHQSKYLRTVKPSSYSSTYSSDARHSAPSLPLPRRQETERKKAASKQTLRLAMRNEPQRQTALKDNNDKQSKQENFSTSTIAAVCHQYKDQVQMQLEQRQTPSQKEQRDYAQLITASESTTSSPYCQMQRLENSFTQRAIGTSLRLAPKCTAAETTRTLKSSLQVAEQSEGNSSQQKGSPQLILPCQDLTGHINRVADEENNERNDGSFLRPAWAVALKVSNSLPIQKETEAADAAGLQLVRVTRGLWTNKEKEAHEFVEPGDTVPHVNSSTFSRVHSSSNADKGVPANAANKPGCFKNKGDTEGSRALSASDAFEWNSSITNIRHEGLSASVSHANCHANSKSVQFKVVKDKDQAFLAVRAIQQAEKEEAIRLLLLEASQNAVEKQAQKRNNEHQRQHQLLEYRLQDHDLSNTDGGKHQTCQSQRRQQSAASSSVGQHQARDPQFAQTAREVLPQPKGGALPKMNQAWSDATPLVHNNENIDTAVITQRHDSESKDIRRDNNVGMAEACSGMTARTLQSSRPKCNVRDKRQQLVVLNNGILERQQGLVRQFQEHYIKEQQGTLGSCRKQDCVERDLQSHTPLKVPSCTGGICLPLQTIRRHSTLQAFQQLFRLPSKTASNQRNLKKKYNFGADMEEVFLPAEIQKSIPTLRKGLSRR